ncbi:Gnk2-homologous domain - like 10 [Theobroma cacao]|nr:Gnk2-homologous domain - like 10 [Theobroma cacao]
MPSIKICLVLVFLSIFSFTSLADPMFLYHFCSNVTTFPGNSLYISNTNNLFAYLSSNATGHDGFYKTTAGRNPNMVYGLYLCRGDVRPEICQDCINLATAGVAQRCPNQTWAIIWYDQCMLRYSNQSIFYSMAESPKKNMLYNRDVTEPERFNRLVATLMQDIATRASNASMGAKKFATKEETFTAFQTIYSLAQCTPDISRGDCYRCLQKAIADLPNCCSGKIGGLSLYPSCNVQYLVSLFYDRSNEPIAAPPPAPPVPPLVLPPPPPGKSKLRNMQSLHFDLSIVEAATDKFAEVNKIGVGGFGSVYKVWRHWKNGTPIELMDSTLQDSYVSNEVLRCIQIGLLCVQEDPSARPTMARVVLMLSSPSVTLPSPKKTAFFFGTITGRKFSEQQSDRSKSTSSSASVNEASITEPFPR